MVLRVHFYGEPLNLFNHVHHYILVNTVFGVAPNLGISDVIVI